MIYFSRFFPSTEKGGGSRRLLQAHDFLKKMVPHMELVYPGRPGFIPTEKSGKIKAKSEKKFFNSPLLPGAFINKWSPGQRGMIYRLREFSRLWLHTVPNLSKLELAVMDDPIYFMPLFKKLIRKGVPVVAVCHNIETLAASQVKKKWTMDLFKKELDILSQCRLVITISREEEVILKNFHIPARFIPYYPVEPIRKRLLDIRQKRLNTQKEGILMLGTLKNLPTKEGMLRAASFWRENHLEQIAGKLIIGGYFSQEYGDSFSGDESTEFHGTFSNEELDGLLCKVNACLCYQESGSGALTRICEMLMAGVPVLANSHAARSYYNTPGVFEFRDLSELENVLKLKQIDTGTTGIPIPQEPDTSWLMEETLLR